MRGKARRFSEEMTSDARRRRRRRLFRCHNVHAAPRRRHVFHQVKMLPKCVFRFSFRHFHRCRARDTPSSPASPSSPIHVFLFHAFCCFSVSMPRARKKEKVAFRSDENIRDERNETMARVWSSLLLLHALSPRARPRRRRAMPYARRGDVFHSYAAATVLAALSLLGFVPAIGVALSSDETLESDENTYFSFFAAPPSPLLDTSSHASAIKCHTPFFTRHYFRRDARHAQRCRRRWRCPRCRAPNHASPSTFTRPPSPAAMRAYTPRRRYAVVHDDESTERG